MVAIPTFRRLILHIQGQPGLLACEASSKPGLWDAGSKNQKGEIEGGEKTGQGKGEESTIKIKPPRATETMTGRVMNA